MTLIGHSAVASADPGADPGEIVLCDNRFDMVARAMGNARLSVLRSLRAML
jgi:hypothetical protein